MLTLVNPLGVYDASTALWLQGKGQQDEVHKLDVDTEVSMSVSVRRTEEFNRQLREQPTDTQLWIKFISYQVRRMLLVLPSHCCCSTHSFFIYLCKKLMKCIRKQRLVEMFELKHN